MPSDLRTAAADLVLCLHFAYILGVILPLVFIPIGARLKWRWVGNRRIRLLHIGMMGFVWMETLLGRSCPLTWLEDMLRERSGEASFVSRLLSQIIFYSFPAWVFFFGYTMIIAWIIFLWIKYPPTKPNGLRARGKIKAHLIF
jgi:hypothetical protein